MCAMAACILYIILALGQHPMASFKFHDVDCSTTKTKMHATDHATDHPSYSSDLDYTIYNYESA